MVSGQFGRIAVALPFGSRLNRRRLTLLLLVLDVAANDPHDAFAADDFAVFADSSDAATHFHGRCSTSSAECKSFAGRGLSQFSCSERIGDYTPFLRPFKGGTPYLPVPTPPTSTGIVKAEAPARPSTRRRPSM